MFSIIIDNCSTPIETIKFSDGGTNIKIHAESIKNYACVVIDPETPANDVLWEAVQAHDALSRLPRRGSRGIYLSLSYLPHGRADRVFEKGNSFPLKIFCEAIAVYDKVFLRDPHSEVVKEFFDEDQLEIMTQAQAFKCTSAYVSLPSRGVLVSPDKGAREKAREIHDMMDRPVSLLVADKTRDPSTGRITSTTIPALGLSGRTCMIVDDILDGGGTFIPLANKLREAGAERVELYVTHGIFSKGLELFKGVLDRIHIFQTVGGYITHSDIINFNKGA